MLFLCCPRCATCKKARAFLDARGVKYDARDIRKDRPTEAELRTWHAANGLPLRRFFNASGLRYRALRLSEKLPSMDGDAQFALLASDGMMVKRPILLGARFVLVGFRAPEWEAKL